MCTKNVMSNWYFHASFISLLFLAGLWQIGKGRVFIDPTVSKELCYSKHKDALLTLLTLAYFMCHHDIMTPGTSLSYTNAAFGGRGESVFSWKTSRKRHENVHIWSFSWRIPWRFSRKHGLTASSNAALFWGFRLLVWLVRQRSRWSGVNKF